MIPNKVVLILTDLLPMIILFSVVMISLRFIYVLYNKEKINVYNEVKNLIYILYTFILFNLVTTTDFESFSNNFVPFKEIFRYDLSSILFFRNVIGNILLFIPFGYMISDMICEKKVIKSLIPVLLMTIITSLTIEIIQMNIGRSFDVDDILLNLIGGFFGYLTYKVLHIFLKKFPNILQNNLLKTLMLLLLVIFVIIFVLKGA